MSAHVASRALFGGALVLLGVGLVGQAFDVFDERTVDAIALLGLGLLGAGQAIRAAREQSARAWIVLALVLGLAAFIALD